MSSRTVGWHRAIEFEAINAAAVSRAAEIVAQWLPEGRREGQEWVALNPRRADRRTGSFKVNLVTGKWADFATGDAGGDLISLGAYLSGLSQGQAARGVAQMIGWGGAEIDV